MLPHPPPRRSSHLRWFHPVPERRPSSDPGRAPLPSRWGASAEPHPVRDPASPEFEPGLPLEEGLPR